MEISESEEQAEFQKALAARRSSAAFKELDELYEQGFALRHVADMLQTNVYSIRSWRRTEHGWFTDLMKVAQLLAVVDFLKEHGIQDPAAWMETPLHKDSELKPMDLYPKDLGLILGMATGRVIPEKVLDIHDTGWRRRGPSKWEVFEGDDGYLSMRLRADPGV